MSDAGAETLADIAKEIRESVDGCDDFWRDREDALALADRIDAAEQREVEEWNALRVRLADFERNKDELCRARAALAPWISLAEWLIKNAGKDALGQGVAEMVPALRARIDESRAVINGRGLS